MRPRGRKSTLEGGALGSAEFAAAAGAEATALAQLGKDETAHALLRSALEIPSRLGRDELYVEIAKLKAAFGDASDAATALAMVVPHESAALANVASLVRGALAIRSGALDEAVAVAKSLETMPCTDVAGLLRGQLLRTRCSVLGGDSDAARSNRRTSSDRIHATISAGDPCRRSSTCDRGRRAVSTRRLSDWVRTTHTSCRNLPRKLLSPFIVRARRHWRTFASRRNAARLAGQVP